MTTRHSALATALALSAAVMGSAWTETAAAQDRGRADAAGRTHLAQNLPNPVPPARIGQRAAPQAGAFDAQQRALVERINRYLSGVHTLIGDFVQVGPDGRRAEGKFYLQKPQKFRSGRHYP